VEINLAFIPSVSSKPNRPEDMNKIKEVGNAMQTYFELKSKYEGKVKEQIKQEIVKETAKMKDKRRLTQEERKKIAAKIIPECVNCKRRVRTVFKTENRNLIAHCGDTEKPCPLMINIFRGDYDTIDYSYADIDSELEEIKDAIIRMKMDVMFGYKNESNIVDKFKKLLGEYNAFNFLKKTLTDLREEALFNVHKREIINLKIQRINELKDAMNSFEQEYKTSEIPNPDVLNVAMNTYVREYLPEVNNLSQLKYEVIEMVTEHNPEISILKQKSASIRSTETIMGEVSQVLSAGKPTVLQNP
jgi:hypothetical protein